jgi:hypothetical protein
MEERILSGSNQKPEAQDSWGTKETEISCSPSFISREEVSENHKDFPVSHF